MNHTDALYQTTVKRSNRSDANFTEISILIAQHTSRTLYSSIDFIVAHSANRRLAAEREDPDLKVHLTELLLVFLSLIHYISHRGNDDDAITKASFMKASSSLKLSASTRREINPAPPLLELRSTGHQHTPC